MLTNPNVRNSNALWSDNFTLSNNFASRYRVSEGREWEEYLIISTPHKVLRIEYYSLFQYRENREDYEDRKKKIDQTLAWMWKNSGVKNPREETIPEFEQLLKLKKVVLECFCKFRKAKVKQSKEKSFVSSTSDVRVKLEKIIVLSYQIAANKKKNKTYADICSDDALEEGSEPEEESVDMESEDDEEEDEDNLEEHEEHEHKDEEDIEPPAKFSKSE